MSELRLFDNEYNCIIAGVDEAGRGPLAGPVVAAAVIIEDYFEELEEINDSKIQHRDINNHISITFFIYTK